MWRQDALRDAHGGWLAELPRLLLAGDLNAEPEEVAALQRVSLLGALQRVDAGLGHTGLSSDFSAAVTIDHAMLSPGLRVLSSAREREPSSPYEAAGEHLHDQPAAVIAPSDHVWQRFELEAV